MATNIGTALLWCEECHYYHAKPADCPYHTFLLVEEAHFVTDEQIAQAIEADIAWETKQERFREYND